MTLEFQAFVGDGNHFLVGAVCVNMYNLQTLYL